MFHPKYDNSTVNDSSSNTEENYGMPSFSLTPTFGLLVSIHSGVKQTTLLNILIFLHVLNAM